MAALESHLQPFPMVGLKVRILRQCTRRMGVPQVPAQVPNG